MKVESRTEHYWVDVEPDERFDTRLDAEVYALRRELCSELSIQTPQDKSLVKDIARYICGNYELHSLRDEDMSDKGCAG